MRSLSIEDVAQIIGAKPLSGKIPPHATAAGVSIDSRQTVPGDLFFALPGEKTDGHEFVKAAFSAGAAAAVVQRHPPGLEEMPAAVLLQVTDVLRALQELARWYRRQQVLPLVGVTGSTGKTTTKDLIAAVLSQRYCTLKTSGNYNNEIGLPLTLLNLSPQHQVAVVEMAMRGPGEISHLCSIAAPSIGVITNIGHTHQELLGSQANIARAKGELLASLPPQGWAVLNGNDPWLVSLAQQAPCPVLYYGLEEEPSEVMLQVSAGQIRSRGREGAVYQVRLPDQQGEVQLSVPGRHNVLNSLAALAVGYLMGMKLEEMAPGLTQARLTAMRLEIKSGINQTTIINDAYNANPDSMRAALRALRDLAGGRSIAVLGEMYELGDYAQEGHNIVGAEAVRQGVSLLVTVGRLASHIAEGAVAAGLDPGRSVHFGDNQAAAAFLRQELTAGDTVLVKGSRGMRMEQVVDALTEKPEG
ncbi:MAG: UDP-N-acetylmuramoyl-tripeptide--D-alanyl-D-alanine ligase [Syntrophomonadaceae bacterium]|nr:UDP-N-acetylmuramoyl-tripeptide--D-alanyl-D-alanine ligase [Syntrophomonadaceae bacterium]